MDAEIKEGKGLFPMRLLPLPSLISATRRFGGGVLLV
jgi:hypothetical protein